MPRSSLVWLLLATPTAVSAQAVLVVTDSVVLEQTSETFLTVPLNVVRTGSDYLVTDAQQPRVFRFDANGRFVRTYGREGDGPGEFREVATSFPVGTDLLAVVSWRPPAYSLFDASSGEFVERTMIAGPIETVVPTGGDLLISGLSGTSSLRRFSDESGQTTSLVPPPGWHRPGSPTAIFGRVPFSAWRDTIALMYEPLPDLVILDSAGSELDRLRIPAGSRRGMPADPFAAIEAVLSDGPYHEIFGVLSTQRAVFRRSDGAVIVVHLDHRAQPPPVTSEGFVSVVDLDNRRACVDAVLALGADAQPAFGFADDRLLVLEQVIRGMDLVAVLRHIEVDTGGCEWIDIVAWTPGAAEVQLRGARAFGTTWGQPEGRPGQGSGFRSSLPARSPGRDDPDRRRAPEAVAHPDSAREAGALPARRDDRGCRDSRPRATSSCPLPSLRTGREPLEADPGSALGE